jgi:hypothetical protein
MASLEIPASAVLRLARVTSEAGNALLSLAHDSHARA